ncbi:MAG: hypothetical protein JO183_06985 [Ktedonobacteraceae bacterium]|nr:hypothetical protein [Ktedonobacteraceae bacterium]MBV8821829.1 hypothetical protein [Ktedonobacteraceae bacterium]
MIASPCANCKGTGEIVVFDEDDSEQLIACPLCEYGFLYVAQPCNVCHATGVVYT